MEKTVLRELHELTRIKNLSVRWRERPREPVRQKIELGAKLTERDQLGKGMRLAISRLHDVETPGDSSPSGDYLTKPWSELWNPGGDYEKGGVLIEGEVAAN